MPDNLLMPEPCNGKTYTLFGNRKDSDFYFREVERLVDLLLREQSDPLGLLIMLRRAGRVRHYPGSAFFGRKSGPDEDFLSVIRESLSPFTIATEDHLRSLSIFKRFNRVLGMGERQYHLFMLEAALTNRIFKKEFLESDIRLAFLPHCLRDLSRQCKAAEDGIDYVCRRCSKNCFIRHITDLLKDHAVEAYIWRTANLSRLFSKLKKDGRRPGVLGIACIPELVRGMRMCTRHGIPVVGLPLNANRCARWMGTFHDNSINMTELEKLLLPDTADH